ncbi:hypothetical protein SS50377_28067 [Spironucleus salmonicida]|uniref:Uncharacterized protein n=1 Tax=Spironucleus salmonicida TaxID=348837 RepID=V6LPG9_9EUKA|nr:hypothetical protein SS50377_28067 [Spironucleus salmonicida]|eukprot:EST42619.1 Hypothetical protein SS50377_17939 [Spironucleus salmonicida]
MSLNKALSQAENGNLTQLNTLKSLITFETLIPLVHQFFTSLPESQNQRILACALFTEILSQGSFFTIFALNNHLILSDYFLSIQKYQYTETARFLISVAAKNLKIFLYFYSINTQKQYLSLFAELGLRNTHSIDFIVSSQIHDNVIISSIFQFGHLEKSIKQQLNLKDLTTDQMLIFSRQTWTVPQLECLFLQLQGVESIILIAQVARNLVFYTGPATFYEACKEYCGEFCEQVFQNFETFQMVEKELFADFLSYLLSYEQVQQQLGKQFNEPFVQRILDVFLAESARLNSASFAIQATLGIAMGILNLKSLALDSFLGIFYTVQPDQQDFTETESQYISEIILQQCLQTSDFEERKILLEVVESLLNQNDEFEFCVTPDVLDRLIQLLQETAFYMKTNGIRYFESSSCARIQQIICKICGQKELQISVPDAITQFFIPEVFAAFGLRPSTAFQALHVLLSAGQIGEFLSDFAQNPLGPEELRAFLPLLLENDVKLQASMRSNSYNQETVEFLFNFSLLALAAPDLEVLGLVENVLRCNSDLAEFYAQNEQFNAAVLSFFEVSRSARSVFKLVAVRVPAYRQHVVALAQVSFFGNQHTVLMSPAEVAGLVAACGVQREVFVGLSAFETGGKDEILEEVRKIKNM